MANTMSVCINKDASVTERTAPMAALSVLRAVSRRSARHEALHSGTTTSGEIGIAFLSVSSWQPSTRYSSGMVGRPSATHSAMPAREL